MIYDEIKFVLANFIIKETICPECRLHVHVVNNYSKVKQIYEAG